MKLCLALLLLFLAAALHLIASVPIKLGAILVAVFGALAFLFGRKVGKWVVCLFALVLVSCTQPPDSKSGEKPRFEVERVRTSEVGPTLYLYRDTKTGVEYLGGRESLIELRTPRAVGVEKP